MIEPSTAFARLGLDEQEEGQCILVAIINATGFPERAPIVQLMVELMLAHEVAIILRERRRESAGAWCRAQGRGRDTRWPMASLAHRRATRRGASC